MVGRPGRKRRFVPIARWTFIIIVGAILGVQAEIIIGAMLTGISVLLALFTPAILHRLYRGKFWSTQAWFFGIEGMPDLAEVERLAFGLKDNRLKWSTNGSILSQHHSGKGGECESLRPSSMTPKELKERRLRVFTIVDTFAMTATAFYAEKPPTVVMVCGREGGMQRALLCSYDWKTQTFVRETVVRMKTLCLERMSRVDRFRFALSREGRNG